MKYYHFQNISKILKKIPLRMIFTVPYQNYQLEFNYKN